MDLAGEADMSPETYRCPYCFRREDTGHKFSCPSDQEIVIAPVPEVEGYVLHRWSRAADIPFGVTVTMPVCSSDTRMRWQRMGPDEFVVTYPGSPVRTRTTADVDAELDAQDSVFVEVTP